MAFVGAALVAGLVVATPSAQAAGLPFYVQAAISSPGAAAGEGFGSRVATSSSGDRVLVGAPDSDASGTDSGAVYAADRGSDGSWSVKRVTLTGVAAGDLAGTSVSINASGTRAVVSAPGRGTGAADHPGQLFVLERSGATWAVAANLITVGSATAGRLGREAAISGDGSVILASVSEHDYAGVTGGLVLPYRLVAGEWTEDQPILDPDPSPTVFSDGGVSFGDEIATSSDGAVALIADPSYDAGGTQPAGVVYAFSRSGGTWTRDQTISAPNATRQYFGYGLGLDASGTTAVIGAPAARSEHGSAFVYAADAGTWSEQAALQAPDDVTSNFGRAVAASGDGATIAVGDFDTRGGGRAGGVFTFTGDAGSWSPGLAQTALTNGADLEDSLALSAAGTTLVVGQSRDDGAATDAGRAQVLVRADAVAVPSAVATPTVAPGDGQLTVSWVAPATGGLPLDGYQIDYRVTGTTPWTTASTSAGVTSRLLAVSNGSSYDVRVRAHNALGWGSFSSIVEGRPGRPPGAPTIASTSLLSNGIGVSWTVVADAEPLTSNTVEYRPQGTSTWTALSTAADVRSLTITGLTRGLTYEVRVKSVNAFGESSPSGSSTVAYQFPAGAPVDVSAQGGNRQLTVTWSPPTDDGGRTITGYLVQTRISGGSWSDTTTAADARSVVVPNLINGNQYDVRVAAVSAVGAGTFSAPITVPVAGVPNAPINASVNPQVEAVTVSWSSGGDGGNPLTGFVVEWRQPWVDAWTSTTVGPSVRSATLRTAAGSIETRVRAVNATGSSVPVVAGTVFVPGLVQSATVSSSVVRPFKDGFQDSTRILVSSNAATKGKIRVLDSRGKLITQWVLPTGTAWSRDWSGRTSSGARVATGTYRVVTTLEWRGAQRTVSTRSVSIASSQVGAPAVSPSSSTVYPARDGYLDQVTIRIAANVPASGKVTISSKGKVLWSGKLSRSRSWAVGWNGRKRSGAVLKPGKYTVTTEVKGGEGKSRTTKRAINVSAKKLTYVTTSKTYSAESARLDCGGFGYVVCEQTDFIIEGNVVPTTRYYTGFTTDDLLWSSHAVPLPAGTSKWRIKAYAATTDAKYVLGYCNSNGSDVDDCPSGQGASFPTNSDGTFVFPWTTIGMTDGRADFFIGSYDWGSVYVKSYTVEYVRRVLK